jgi:hypothetical protein
MEQLRKRLFVSKKTGVKERLKIIEKSGEKGYNTLVFSFDDKYFTGKNNRKFISLIKRFSFNVEAGGCDLSLMVPKRLFFFHRDLFRMEQGKRKKNIHFCPTNPETTILIAKYAYNLFERTMKKVTTPRIFHLLPDYGHESIWCQCPACRAFRPVEQYLIAVNTAADALAKLDPLAKISFVNFDTELEAARIPPRKNMFKLLSSPS